MDELNYSSDNTLEPISPISMEEGNTKTSSIVPITEVKNHKRLKISTVSGDRCRRWCFTWFIPEEQISNAREKLVIHFNQEGLMYCIGDEVCPSTGKVHLQGYVEFKNQKKFNQLKLKYPSRIHWEPAKGNRKQNYEYCLTLISPEGPLMFEDFYFD